MRAFLLLLAFLASPFAQADAPVIWSGTTAKWLPSGLRSAGLCKTAATGVQTVYTTDGIVKMSSGVPGAAVAGTDYQAAGNYITALTSDVTATGPGSVASTVAKIQGTTVSGTTGTTNVVFSTSPTMSNPVVGTQANSDNSTLAASTAYVQTALAQLNPAAAVAAASTANIAGTYTNAVGGVCIADTFQVTSTAAFAPDGVTLTVGQRFLMKDQTNTFQDGVWTLTTAANVGVLGALLTRALDDDSSSDFNAGQIVPVQGGTVNAGSSWYRSTSGNVTCNSDAQTWTQFQRATSAYALLASTNTFTANNIFSVAGAASTPGLSVTGAPFVGTATTGTPQLNVGDGSAATTWGTAGTYLGINGAAAFAGNLFDFKVNNATVYSGDYLGGFLFRNVTDNANKGPIICGQTGAPASSGNCIYLYASNAHTFKFYSLNATQGAEVPLGFDNNLANVVVGGATYGLTNTLSIQSQPAAAYNAYNSVAIFLKSSQTGDYLRGVENDGSTVDWKFDVNGMLTVKNITDSSLGTGIVHSGSGGAFTSSAVNLASADVTGTLPVANGGTGLATLTSHALYAGNGTSAPTALAVGATNTLLHGNTGADPSYSAVVNADIANSTIDLTAKVTGALPIANGGTGQTAKAAAFDALQPMTTSGDIIYGGTSGTGTRLAKGADGTVLTLASGVPSWATNSPTAPTCEVTYNGCGASCHGSTDTDIFRYGTTQRSAVACASGDLTSNGGVDSATSGTTFTVATAGIWCISVSFGVSGSTCSMGITINDTAKTTVVQTPITYAQGLRAIASTAANSSRANISWCGKLSVNDVIRAHDDTACSYNSSESMITVTRVL